MGNSLPTQEGRQRASQGKRPSRCVDLCPCMVLIRRHMLRSEEHTSELQSLMRLSYAVFCLKQNKLHTTTSNHHSITHPRRHSARHPYLQPTQTPHIITDLVL